MNQLAHENQKKVPWHKTRMLKVSSGPHLKNCEKYIVLHMYLGDYVQDSEHRKDPVTSTNGHNCAKDAIT